MIESSELKPEASNPFYPLARNSSSREIDLTSYLRDAFVRQEGSTIERNIILISMQPTVPLLSATHFPCKKEKTEPFPYIERISISYERGKNARFLSPCRNKLHKQVLAVQPSSRLSPLELVQNITDLT